MVGTALIVGAGEGLSASLARLFHKEGMQIVLAARNITKLEELSIETKSLLKACDSSKISDVERLFEFVDKNVGIPDIVIYNPSMRIRGSIIELDPNETKKAIEITCFGAFLVAQHAAKRMLKRGSGSIFFTGASAGIKGFANSSVFAMGKFGLRGLAQALARELHPKNIHIGHFIIDGGIGSMHASRSENSKLLNPEEIAKNYLFFHNQHQSSWAWEIELRPSLEVF